jgi:membrane-bound metal-dependent hydrolase YbcI (DUF457 family)
MDPFSHYMFAYTLGKWFKADRQALMGITLGSWLPDIDAISILFGWEVFSKTHPSVTHSLLLGLILAEISTIIFFLFFRKVLFKWIFAGAMTHLALDLGITNSYPLLYPLSRKYYTITPFLPRHSMLWTVMATFFLLFAFSTFIYYIRKGAHPWRIWLDERKILKRFSRP